MASELRNVAEAVVYFYDSVNCREYLAVGRWPNGVTCPRCGSKDVLFLKKYNRWHWRAKHYAPQFTLKTGTTVEDSPLGLDKWLLAMWMVVNFENGVGSHEIHRATGVTQKSPWMNQRIRLALAMGSNEKQLSGEVDETFIDGKARNMHGDVRERRIRGTGPKGKVAMMGILERGGKVRTFVVPSRKKKVVQAEAKKHVEAGSRRMAMH